MDIHNNIRPATLEEAFDLRPVQRSKITQEAFHNNIYREEIIILETTPVNLQFEQKPFIEANTQEVDLIHLSNDCIIPVFSKDNEKTIAHQEYIEVVMDAVKKAFPNESLSADYSEQSTPLIPTQSTPVNFIKNFLDFPLDSY